MAFHEIIQTTCALSGLTCLMLGILSLKKYLKAYIR